MSQRRQEARRAKQEQRRAARHRARVAARTAAAPARTATVAVPPQRTWWTTRTRWIVFGGLAGVVLIAIVAWIVQQVFFVPLPGEKFPSQGNAHLADASSPHDPYNSNPPTSGWHLADLPKPGIYTTPKRPEDFGHFMEHGGVWIVYNCPDGCPADVEVLTQITNDAIDRGRPVALAPYLQMDERFAVVAWQWLLKLNELDQGQIKNFINRHACRYNPEGGPYCSGVRGKIDDPTGSRSAIPMQRTVEVTNVPISVFGTQTPVPATTVTATPAP